MSETLIRKITTWLNPEKKPRLSHFLNPKIIEPPLAKLQGKSLRRARQIILARKTVEVQNLLGDPAIQEQIRDLDQSDERIFSSKDRFLSVYVHPFSDDLYYLHRAIYERLPKKRYHSVVCFQSGPNHASERTVNSLIATLRRLRPEEEILVLRTAGDNSSWRDLLPVDVDSVDISDLHAAAATKYLEVTLRAVLFGVNPKRIVNVDSRLGFSTTSRFGKQLSRYLHLYCFMEDFDRAPNGKKRGVITDFFPACFPFYTAIFSHDPAVKADIVRQYSLPPEHAEKIIPLPTEDDRMIADILTAETKR